MVYLSTQIEGGELSYNMPGILTLEGKLDMNRLQTAFQRLIQRHESLRTGFEMVRRTGAGDQIASGVFDGKIQSNSRRG